MSKIFMLPHRSREKAEAACATFKPSSQQTRDLPARGVGCPSLFLSIISVSTLNVTAGPPFCLGKAKILCERVHIFTSTK